MVIKVFVSGISGSKEVKKRQQRVLLILDSKNIKYDVIDIAEPGAEEAKDFMHNNSTSNGATISDPNPRHPLPPQIFNEDVYCGDYDQFDMANEIDEMEKFLKMAVSENLISNAEIKLKNGEVASEEKEIPQEEEKQSAEESEVVNEKENEETEEKTKDEEVKKSEESKETEDSKENDQSKEEENDNEELKNQNETKEESGAGDEQNGDEESETKEAKADEA